MSEFNSESIKSYEVESELHPVCVACRCPNCNNGEMEAIPQDTAMALLGLQAAHSNMVPHKCKSCGIVLQLPRQYPYVKFLTDAEYAEFKKSKEDGDTDGADEVPVGS